MTRDAITKPDPLALAKLLSEADAAEDSHTWADNTKRAYTTDLATFAKWCAGMSVQPFPSPPDIIRAYVTWLIGEGRKLSTIKRALAAISQAHKQQGHESPCGHAKVTNLIKALAKRSAKDGKDKKKRAAALTPDQVVNMAATCDSTSLTGLRDRAVLLVGFSGAFRRSELAAVDVSHVTFVPEGMTIHVPFSKTDQNGVGMTKPIKSSDRPERCPVRALRAWLEASGISSGPVFRGVSRHGTVGRKALGDRTVDTIIKDTAARAGIAVEVSGHSLRAGFITSSRRAGHRAERIRAISGHKEGSRVFEGYIREADLWSDHAGEGLL